MALTWRGSQLSGALCAAQAEMRRDALKSRQELEQKTPATADDGQAPARHFPNGALTDLPRSGTVITRRPPQQPGKKETSELKHEHAKVMMAVDLEEMDQAGRYNTCLIKDNHRDEPACIFRVTAGSARAKRFVITVVQTDHNDFVLERWAVSPSARHV